MIALWITAGAALLASLVADRRKTRASLIRGLKTFWAIVPLLLGVLAVVSLLMAAVTPEMLQRALSGSGPLPFCAALGVGSVALVPGFIAYPLAGVLRENGASTPVLAAFITSLMMVGVLTLPIEAKFFGWRVSLLRNGLAFVGAVLVAVGMAWVLP
ncbi:MAG: permease [Proteobacteria bacterium]|nr:permease [Pseudomonadota bacterium]